MISVVMATYNGIKFIKEQLDSICNQTLLPDEIIIQDDLSTDGTFEYIIEYSKKYSNIKWIINKNQKNLGYKKNFFEGICKASGDYIFLCDQDDIWLDNKIELMLKAMEKNSNIKLLMSNLKSFYQENCNNKVHEEFGGIFKIKHYKNLNHAVNTPRPGCSFCIRRILIEEYKKNVDFNIPHDNLIWHLASMNKEAYLLNKVTMKYRRHSSNASNNVKVSKEKRLNAIKYQLYSLDFIEKKCINSNDKKYFKKQKEVFEKRYEIISKKDIIGNIKLLRYFNFYYTCRLWIIDMWYCIRRK